MQENKNDNMAGEENKQNAQQGDQKGSQQEPQKEAPEEQAQNPEGQQEQETEEQDDLMENLRKLKAAREKAQAQLGVENEEKDEESQASTSPAKDQDQDQDQGSRKQAAEEQKESQSQDSGPEDEHNKAIKAEAERKAQEAEQEAKESTTQAAASSEAKKEEKDSEDQPQYEDKEEDQEEDEDDIEEEEIDYYAQYQGMDADTLYAAMLNLTKQPYSRKAEEEVRALTSHFEDHFEHEKREALARFIEKGGDKADFDFSYDLGDRFFSALKLWKERKGDFLEKQEAERKENFKQKQAILKQLRDFVDAEVPTTDISALRKLQDEWRSIGPVPRSEYREMIRNYRALIQRFFDNRSIYFELKDLDREKNQKLKKELIEQAKGLLEEDSLNKAMKELRALHSEYKDVGPVPKGQEKILWEEFKGYSDKLYEKRDEFFKERREKRKGNLEDKQKLIDQVQEFAEFDSGRIDDWNAQTKKILELKDQWQKAGMVPKEVVKETNAAFWNPFKTFFKNKSEFFKKLESKREANLELKKELFEEAKKDADKPGDRNASKKLSELQKRWNKLGPLPKKNRKMGDAFRKMMDDFFDAHRAKFEAQEKEQEANLQAKEALISEMETAAQKAPSRSDVEDLYERWSKIGFVPKKHLKRISKAFDKAFESLIAASKEIDDADSESFKLNLKLGLAGESEDARQDLRQMEKGLQNKIRKLEEELNLYKTNLERFASSKNANALQNEVSDKLEKQEKQIKGLKKKLQTIRQALSAKKKQPTEKNSEAKKQEKPSEEKAPEAKQKDEEKKEEPKDETKPKKEPKGKSEEKTDKTQEEKTELKETGKQEDRSSSESEGKDKDQS